MDDDEVKLDQEFKLYYVARITYLVLLLSQPFPVATQATTIIIVDIIYDAKIIISFSISSPLSYP